MNVLLLVIFVVIALSGCQTTSKIAPHYNGQKAEPITSSQSVRLEKMGSKEEFIKRGKILTQQGYSMVGSAFFTGLQDGPTEIKKFAASIGADCVLSAVQLVGTSTESYMGVDSFTPGQTITTYGTASAYGTGTGSGTIRTPYGPMGYNSQTSGTAYGSGTSTTYIPAQVTYSPKYYEVPITDQAYVFLLSPQGYLRNWRKEWLKGWEKANSSRSTPQPAEEEEMKVGAMYFAQAWNLVLPKEFKPTTPVRDLSAEERKKYREIWVSKEAPQKP
jgi:hypothetical protein